MSLTVDREHTLPLSELRSHGDDKVRAAAATNEATVLTERGERVAVVLSPDLYESLLDAVERLELIEALDEAEVELAAGQTIPYSAVRGRLLEWAGETD